MVITLVSFEICFLRISPEGEKKVRALYGPFCTIFIWKDLSKNYFVEPTRRIAFEMKILKNRLVESVRTNEPYIDFLF
jgi:hypothetical protein